MTRHALRADDVRSRVSVARSHVGRVRSINEDRVLDCPTAGLWAVADGMGGHSGGDVAAQLAVDRLRLLAAAGTVPTLGDVLSAVWQANSDIRHHNASAGTDAGTTVVAATISEDVASIAWAGDSRAYRLRDGRLELLTHDHSFVQELVDAKLLTPAQAELHPRANVVTRALGVGDAVACDTVTVALAPDDRLLLCSDGFSRSLSAEDHWTGSDLEMVEAMIAVSLERGGSDNISVVLIR